MSVLEAMACGRPVVVTDDGGLRYIVADEGGRRVPVGNPDKLAAALIEILKDPTLSQSMGDFNRRQAESLYAWDRVIDRIEALYDDVMEGRPASQPAAYRSCAS